jgi:DNA polymerase
MNLHIDIESRSRVDLKTAGVYNYAMDPSTEILFIAWAIGADPIQLWYFKDPFPKELGMYFEMEDLTICAHNAAFERLMFWYILCPEQDIPEPALERFYCTAALARANALPDKLELCARALGGQEQKDHRGARLIQQLSIPNKETGEFNEDPALMYEFGQYCKQDVATERDICRHMRDFTPAEVLDYIVSEEINDRGIMVDVDFAQVVVGYAKREKAEVARRTAILTKGQIATPGSPKFTEWVYERLEDAHQPIMETTANKSGFTFDSTAVDHLFNINDELSGEVQQAIRLKAMASKSSVSKFQNMVHRAGEDDRVRGAFVLYGAGQTHRYSSRGLQVHNLPRDTASDPFEIRGEFIDGTVDGEELFTKLKSMVRPTLMPRDDCTFVCQDWSAIEARVLPWLSDDRRAEKVLDVFRRGEDIYLAAAEDLPDQDRQLGKVTILSMGFGGGVGAFQTMAHNYGVYISDGDANRIKVAWRKANPWAPDFWHALEDGAKRAVRNPGVTLHVGRVRYVCINGVLYCILPSGTMLSYPKVTLKLEEGKFGAKMELSCLKASLRPKADAPDWPRMTLWGGILAENITQATAADLLRGALVRVREWSDEVVLHAHDEILMEVPYADAADAFVDLGDEMLVVPDWAEGLPLAVGGWTGDYYRKV